MMTETPRLQQSPDSPSGVLKFRDLVAWTSFAIGIVCASLFANWPLHPKSGDDDVRAIVVFVCLSAVGIGSSLFGMRRCEGIAKVAAYIAFACFAFVALNLLNDLANA